MKQRFCNRERENRVTLMHENKTQRFLVFSRKMHLPLFSLKILTKGSKICLIITKSHKTEFVLHDFIKDLTKNPETSYEWEDQRVRIKPCKRNIAPGVQCGHSRDVHEPTGAS